MNHYPFREKKETTLQKVVSIVIEGAIYIAAFAVFYGFVWLMCAVCNAFMY